MPLLPGQHLNSFDDKAPPLDSAMAKLQAQEAVVINIPSILCWF